MIWQVESVALAHILGDSLTRQLRAGHHFVSSTADLDIMRTAHIWVLYVIRKLLLMHRGSPGL